MLVQARGTLIAVRLVPTPSSYSNPSLHPASHVGVAPRLTLSFFAPLSFERDSEYRSGLSYACGVSRLAKDTHARACARNGLTYVRGPRSVGRLAGRSVGAEKVYTKATSLLSMRERVPVNARTSLAAYTQIWMVHGPVLTRERAPRAARRRLGHNAREIRATPLFFLLLFHPESSARPCVGYLLLYSRYLDTFHDLLSFVTSAVSSSSFFSPLLLHGQRFSPRILLLPFHARAISPLNTFPIALYRVFMRFCHFCF